MLGSKLKMGVMASSMALLLAACTSSQDSTSTDQQEKKEVTFLSNFPSETLDPHLNWTPVRAGVAETLIKINEELKLEPWLAKEWSSDESGQVWTFTIQDDVTFQNGKKVDGEAVKVSLERNIDVSESMKSALKIQAVEANGQTVTITLEEPMPHFPSELVHPNTAIIDVTEENVEEKPVGTEPFTAVSFEANSQLELERYEDYWDGKANLDGATFTFNEDANARTLALQSGDADIVYRPAVESLESLQADSSLKTDVVSSLRTHFIMYNTKTEALSDPNVRKVFDVLMDRQEVADSIMAGQAAPAAGPFLPDFSFSPSYEEKAYGIDVAKKYLAEAGYEMKDGQAVKDGKALSLTILTYAHRPELPLMAQLLQSKAKELGITIDIQQVENIDEYLVGDQQWDLATYSLLTAPRGDASYFLNAVYMPDGAMNYGHINNEPMNTMVEELNRTIDEEKRTELAKSATSIIEDEILHSFIVHPNNFVAYKADVQGWVTSKSEFYMLTKDLDVKTK